MRDSFFKMVGSVRLVQEVSRSASSSPTLTPTESPQGEDLSHHQQHTTTTTTTTSNTSETTTNIKVNSQPPIINNVIPMDNDNDIDDSHTPINTDYNTNKNNDDHDTINNKPMTELTMNKSHWTGLQKTSITVPKVNYPVSLASYLPGITPGYANSRTTLPSWMVNNSTSTLNARSKRKHTRENSFYSIRQHKPKQPSLSTLEQEEVLNMQSMQQQQQHVSVSAFAIGASPNNITSSLFQQQQNTPLLTFNNSNNNNNDNNDNNDRKMGSLMINDKLKPKSQKLLCLWPLPIITRYIIGISLLVSIMNFIGFFHLKCSSPSYVIHRLEIMNLLLSPFLFTGSLHTFLLFGWNILILGLFEESLAHMLGGTRRFVKVLVGILLSVCMMRQGIGYLFSKSTGFAVPSLFFSDSLHECNQGLAPFLFALLIVQSLSIDDKYILMYGPETSNQKMTVRKVALQLVMCLMNYTVKNILWWSLTGLLTGSIMTIIIQTCLAHQRTWFEDMSQQEEETNSFSFLMGGEEQEKSNNNYESFIYHQRRIPLWRILWSTVKKGALVVMITLPVLLMCNAYYTRESFVDPTVLNQVTHDRYMFSFVVMTAPRRGNPAYLSRTLASYLENWPVNPPPGSLYDRVQGLVYTHFTNHTQFDIAKNHFSHDPKGQRYLKWIREEGNLFDQRLHVSKALSLVADHYQSTYIALLEDDFPVCGENEWRQIENVIYHANQRVPGHCGVFVGTGGSGLFMKPKIAKLVSGLLLKYTDTPPDIVVQQCLAGDLPECSECSQTLVTSKKLLMYHIGFNTSTSHDRTYKKHDFQCGWRHPFNGDPGVITL